MSQKVLVTGGSGFIGSRAIPQLLAAGHQVRTTIRNLKREGDVSRMGNYRSGSRGSVAGQVRRQLPDDKFLNDIGHGGPCNSDGLIFKR
jgi:nucleoside-diphosphate-sugar epimerase